MHKTEDRILDRLGIRHEPIGADGLIVPTDARFWEMAGLAMPEAPVALCDAFEEAFGGEEAVEAALAGGAEFRLSGFERGSRYLDLRVFPVDGGEQGRGSAGVVVLEDATEAMRTRQTLVQSKNEASMLGVRLERSHEELREANASLDRLLREIRTRNHDLDFQVKLRTRELHLSRLSALTTLARIAEFRDTDTGDHIYRLGRSGAILGRRMGLSELECEELFYASLLHDVGKIGIPDSVLLKPGKLDADEWAVMRGHTRIGADILSRGDHSFFHSAREVALHHHERWDGSGYPDGLSGSAIPLSCRICSVADVFDALTSERPYKKAWSLDEALGLLRSESGAAFDPAVLEAFLASKDEIVAMRGEPPEPEFLLPGFD